MKKNSIILPAFFLSGAAGLIYEVTWMKPIGTIYQSTIYVVSLVLTAFMLGLSLGSLLAGRFMDRTDKPLLWYAYFQLGIALYSLLLLNLFNILPFVFDRLMRVRTLAGYNILQFLSVFLLLLVPTTLMGATFPAVSRSYIKEKAGEGMGEIFSANNAGAIIGSLSAGFILIPHLGIRWTVTIAAFLNMTAAFLVIFNLYGRLLKTVFPAGAAFFILLSAYGNYNLTNLYSKGVFGLIKKDFIGKRKIIFYKEGLYGSVAVMEEGRIGEVKRLLLNGQGSSSLRMSDVRVSTLLGYLSVLCKPDSGNALVVGFGIGATSNILARHFRTTTLEIEPKVLETAVFFNKINDNVLGNPAHSVIINDARNHLSATKDKYDIIVNHPLEPYQSFSSLLFTREFLETAKSRLNEGGIYTQWFPVYDLSDENLKDFLFTFNSVFPYQLFFINIKKDESINYILDDGRNIYTSKFQIPMNGAELIIIGSGGQLDPECLKNNFPGLTQYDREFLNYTSLDSPERLYNLMLFTGDEIRDFYTKARFITDDRPNLEFSTPFNRIRNPLRTPAALENLLNKTSLTPRLFD